MLRLTAVFVLLSQTALADVTVRFTESAPKDSFRIVNAAACATGPIQVTVDLSGSASGLIFDTTGQGAGVEVFQPFELVAGGDVVATSGTVSDGDKSVTLGLRDLPVGGEVAFTIDVDDTLPSSANGQIMVSGSEIAGATARAVQPGGVTSSGTFDAKGMATLAMPDCAS